MSKKHRIDGVDVELDDDISPSDLDKGAAPRGEDLDLDALEAEARRAGGLGE